MLKMEPADYDEDNVGATEPETEEPDQLEVNPQMILEHSMRLKEERDRESNPEPSTSNDDCPQEEPMSLEVSSKSVPAWDWNKKRERNAEIISRISERNATED